MAVRSRGMGELKVLVASGIPVLCAFGWAVHVSRSAARPPLVLDLAEPQLFVGLTGFSARETWGRWTLGKEASLVLGAPLPPRFTLTLEARAYGPNAGLPVEVQAGDARGTLVLGPTPETQSLSFEGATGRRVVFRIPRPVSPRESGAGNDDRSLGIGVSRLAIRVPGGTG